MSQGPAEFFAEPFSFVQYRVLVPLYGPGRGRGAQHVWAGVLLRGAVSKTGGHGYRAASLRGLPVPNAWPGHTWGGRSDLFHIYTHSTECDWFHFVLTGTLLGQTIDHWTVIDWAACSQLLVSSTLSTNLLRHFTYPVCSVGVTSSPSGVRV